MYNNWTLNTILMQIGVISVKQHRFWAWGAVICMIMVMVTGYKRK